VTSPSLERHLASARRQKISQLTGSSHSPANEAHKDGDTRVRQSVLQV